RSYGDWSSDVCSSDLGVTKVLVDQRSSLAEILDVAPVGLSNLVNTYNGASGTLDARPNLNELTQPPLVMICRLLKQTPQPLGARSEERRVGQECRARS